MAQCSTVEHSAVRHSTEQCRIADGTAEASCALIGYCIGSGNVALARRFFRLTATIACCEAICLSTLIFLGSHQIASFYSTNEDV